MKPKRYPVNRAMSAAAVLLCLVLVTTYMVSGYVARYATSSSVQDSARVAAFAFTVEEGMQTGGLDLSQLKCPGDQVSYPFTVSNVRDGNVVSEVAQSYTIDLSVAQCGLPIQLRLDRKDSAEEATHTMDMLEGDGVAQNKTLEVSGEFPAGEAQSHQYVLTVLWDEGRNDVGYAGQSAELALTVTGQQAD